MFWLILQGLWGPTYFSPGEFCDTSDPDRELTKEVRDAIREELKTQGLIVWLKEEFYSTILKKVLDNECSLDKKCYPLGYRKSGEYCSDGNQFIAQLEGSTQCNNNFECQSNVCVSGQCVEINLIQKILEWFRNLFGGEWIKFSPPTLKTRLITKLFYQLNQG